MTFLRWTVILLTYQWGLPMDVSQLQLYAPCYVKRSNLWLFTRTEWAGRDSPWEVRRRAQADACASLRNLTVSTARAATTWRRSRGRAGMCGMPGAALEPRVPAARALPSSLCLPARAAPRSPTSFSWTPRAGDSSASRRAGRGLSSP